MHQEPLSRPRSLSLPDAVVLLLLACMVGLIAGDPDAIHHDCAQYVQGAQMILQGSVPFVDIYDTNPPLIMYLSMLPAGLAELTGASPTLTFQLFILCLVVCSLISLRRQLRNPGSALTAGEAGGILIGFASASVLTLLFESFGQREHLLCLALFPFFMHRYRHWETPDNEVGPTRGWLYGLFAGVAICLKPHYVVLWLLFEAYCSVRYRRMRPLLSSGVAVILVSFLAYAAYLLWLMPLPARETLWGWIGPLVRQGYAAYEAPVMWILRAPLIWACLGIACLPLIARRGDGSGSSIILRALGLVTVGAVGLHIAQHKGWLYHLLPAITGASLVSGAFISHYPLVFRGETAAGSNGWVIPCTAAGFRKVLLMFSVLAVPVMIFLRHLGPADKTQALAAFITENSRSDERVLICSTAVSDVYPTLIRAGRFQASRYLCMWPVPGFYKGQLPGPDLVFPYHEPYTAPPDELRFLRELAEDIRRFRPPIILVRSTTPFLGCPPRFNLLEYLETSGFLSTAMSSYLRPGTIAGYTVFALEGRMPLRREQ